MTFLKHHKDEEPGNSINSNKMMELHNDMGYDTGRLTAPKPPSLRIE
jgi:hypothetical protein